MPVKPRLVKIKSIQLMEGTAAKQMYVLETLSGRRIKVSSSLLAILLEMDGRKSVEEIAIRASQRLGNILSAQDVDKIIKQLLVPQHLLESEYEAPVKNEYVSVTFDGIDRAYAEAIATICEVGINGYKEIYGINLLKACAHSHVYVYVSRSTRSTRLYTDDKDSIYWHIDSEEALLPPSVGGARNVYGFCHELGHLAFRPVDNTNFNEGWACYAAAYRILPYLWDKLGEKAWPQPHNYLMESVPDRFPSWVPGTPSAAAELFLYLDKCCGPEVLGSVIEGLRVTGGRVSIEDFKRRLVGLTSQTGLWELFSAKGF